MWDGSKNFNLELTSDEMLLILKGLSYIYKQSGLNDESKQEVYKLGIKLSKKTKDVRQKIGFNNIDPFLYFINKKINVKLKG